MKLDSQYQVDKSYAQYTGGVVAVSNVSTNLKYWTLICILLYCLSYYYIVYYLFGYFSWSTIVTIVIININSNFIGFLKQIISYCMSLFRNYFFIIRCSDVGLDVLKPCLTSYR